MTQTTAYAFQGGEVITRTESGRPLATFSRFAGIQILGACLNRGCASGEPPCPEMLLSADQTAELVAGEACECPNCGLALVVPTDAEWAGVRGAE